MALNCPFKEEPVSCPHIVMRKIRDVLRLSIGEGLPLRQVGASLHTPATTRRRLCQTGKKYRPYVAVPHEMT
jgi:hypothetical protein